MKAAIKKIVRLKPQVSATNKVRVSALTGRSKIKKLKVPKEPPFEPFCELKAEYSEDRSRGGEDIDDYTRH